jgi:hypothetical protein
MGKAHKNRKKTAQPKHETNALATGRRSTLSIESKLLLYKAVLKSIWTYEIQLWETASNSNIEILQRVQSMTLRSILKTTWYINNHRIHEDLQIKTMFGETKNE